MTPSHYDDGWHITGTCGVIGAAVAAGVLMDFDEAHLASAIGLAAQMTLGHREAFGTPIKPFHAGKAAANRLFAASLARAGMSGGSDCFVGEPNYFSALSHKYQLGVLSPQSLAERMVLLDNTYKPFPCGIVVHPAIEAGVNMHSRFGDDDGSVERVSVRCNPLVPELMGRTVATTTGLEARFCAIHGVSVGLLYGRGGLAEFSDEQAVNPRVVVLRAKTVLEPDESCPLRGGVTVTWKDGKTDRSEVQQATGSLERPLSDEALLAKFTALVEAVLPGGAESIAEAALGVGGAVGPSELAAVIAASMDSARTGGR